MINIFKQLNIMIELLVLLGFEVTLLLAIAAMRAYRWRTDVLTGPYIRRQGPAITAKTGSDTGAEKADRWTVENDARASSAPLPGRLEEGNRSAPIHLDQIHER